MHGEARLDGGSATGQVTLGLDRLAFDDLQRQLKVNPHDLVVFNERTAVDSRPESNVMHDRIARAGASPTDHVLVAPFKVAVRQRDGTWLVVQPKPSFRSPSATPLLACHPRSIARDTSPGTAQMAVPIQIQRGGG